MADVAVPRWTGTAGPTAVPITLLRTFYRFTGLFNDLRCVKGNLVVDGYIGDPNKPT